MNSIFQRQMQSQLGQLKANPASFLLSRQFNIPGNMTQSPQQMIEAITGVKIPQEYANNPSGYFNYLLSNSQLSQQQQMQLMNAASMFKL